MTRCMKHWMKHWMNAAGVWKEPAFSTASLRRRSPLWEAGDSGGTATRRLTCGDVGFSTIHSPYYCS
jgi:hypothetical protein